MKRSLHQRVGEGTRVSYAEALLRMPGFGKNNVQLAKSRINTQSFSSYIDQMVGPHPTNEMLEIVRLHRVTRFFRLYTAAAEQLVDIFRGVVYIGPARSRSERYYRYQELSVSEIDPDGTNFPMFLNSLTSQQIETFSGWVLDLFGYGVKISRREGHISINVFSSGTSMNIVDTGYGISQILPVLGQIWWTVFGSQRSASMRGSILAIEQPELHLYPAHQALLADALASVFQTGGHPRRPINFIIETHSEALVNRLGELISNKLFDKNKVSIIVFEELKDTPNSTETRVAEFTDSGELTNWPYGFFGTEFK